MDSGRLVENIRRFCREKNVSIMQMERDLGFSSGLISRWNKSKTCPSFDKIVEIMRYLNITYDELMEGVLVSNSAKQSNSKGNGDGDDDIIEHLEEGSISRDIEWERAEEGLPFEISTDIVFHNMLNYDMHRFYYTAYKKGWFLYSVQYNEETMEVSVAVFMLTAGGMELRRLEAEEACVLKLLKVIDEEFFNRINQDQADKMKEDFMGEKFEGRYRSVS